MLNYVVFNIRFKFFFKFNLIFFYIINNIQKSIFKNKNMFIFYLSSYIITNLCEIEITLYHHLKLKNGNSVLHKYSKKKSSKSYILNNICIWISSYKINLYNFSNRLTSLTYFKYNYKNSH